MQSPRPENTAEKGWRRRLNFVPGHYKVNCFNRLLYIANLLHPVELAPLSPDSTPSTASLPPQKGKKCNLCVRYDLLPMSRVAHKDLSEIWRQGTGKITHGRSPTTTRPQNLEGGLYGNVEQILKRDWRTAFSGWRSSFRFVRYRWRQPSSILSNLKQKFT